MNVTDVEGFAPDFIHHNTGNYHPTNEQIQRLHEIAALVAARRVYEIMIADRVKYLRENQGTSWNQQLASWEQIGQALGVTKQAAAKKYSA